MGYLVVNMKSFKIGEEVELINYEPYSDYVQHEGQFAVVMGLTNDPSLPIKIKWEDGSASHVSPSNLILVSKRIDLRKPIL
jgi:hypothetical protein